MTTIKAFQYALQISTGISYNDFNSDIIIDNSNNISYYEDSKDNIIMENNRVIKYIINYILCI